MRKMKMALAVIAVLVMASTTFAGLTLTVDPFTTPQLGYDSWLVRAGWDGVGDPITTFVDINIAGTVVQSNMFEIINWETMEEAPIPTVWNPNMPAAHKAMDTHLMMAKPTAVLGETGRETNAKGITPPAPLGGFYTGLGTFTSDEGAVFGFAAAPAVGSPFMQIVLPEYTQVHLTGTTNAGGVIDEVVGRVPEPGTIALLIAGALCLVVARFRK